MAIRKRSGLFEVVRVLDLEPIVPVSDDGSQESFKFRIEVLHEHSSGEHFVRVYRHETFRIPPTFPVAEDGAQNQAWDKELLVRDEARDWDRFRGRSADEVVEAVLKEITEVFGLDESESA